MFDPLDQHLADLATSEGMPEADTLLVPERILTYESSQTIAD